MPETGRVADRPAGGNPCQEGERRTPGSGPGHPGAEASVAARKHRADTSRAGTGLPGPLRTRANRVEPPPPPDSSAYWRTAGQPAKQGSPIHRLRTWTLTKSQTE